MCEHHNPSICIRQDVLSHFLDESHPALLSFTVLACSETSAAGLTPHCSKKKKSHVRKQEKESETCEMKKEQRDIWLSVALLAVADVIRRDYRNTILSQITSPPLRLTAVSLSASRVGHPAVIIAARTLGDFSVHFLFVNHLYSSHSSPGLM